VAVLSGDPVIPDRLYCMSVTRLRDKKTNTVVSNLIRE
jgi:hypothetical protein